MRNKNILLFISCILLFWACKDKNSDATYTIEGSLTELTSPDIYLVSFTSPEVELDTINARKGKFSYKNSTDSLQAILLYMQEKSTWITVWVKNGDQIKINGDINYPELLEVEGNEINDQLTTFKQQNEEDIKKRQDLLETLQFNRSENLSIRSDNEIYAEVLQLQQNIKDQALRFIRENPSSIASLVLLQDYVINNEKPSTTKDYLDLLSGEAKENPLYSIVAGIVNRLSETSSGNSAPDFSIVDTQKDTLSLDTFAEKYLLLTFSLTDNDSCRYFLDSAAKLLKKESAPSLNILTLSLDNDTLIGKNYAEKMSSRWFHAIDEDGWNADIVSAFNITMITDNVLIDKEGLIAARNIPVDSIKTIIINETQ